MIAPTAAQTDGRNQSEKEYSQKQAEETAAAAACKAAEQAAEAAAAAARKAAEQSAEVAALKEEVAAAAALKVAEQEKMAALEAKVAEMQALAAPSATQRPISVEHLSSAPSTQSVPSQPMHHLRPPQIGWWSKVV